MMLRSFSNMVPDALLTYFDLPRELEPLLAVDRFSNFLFSQWPIHAAHSEYPLVVDLRTARRYEDYSVEQQRCLLTFLQRAAIVKIGYPWVDRAWEWRNDYNFYTYTEWRGPVGGIRRRSRYLGDSLWYFSSTPVPSPLHLHLTQQGALSRMCFLLTDYRQESDEPAVYETVLGSRRPKKGFLLELTLLIGRGRAHLAEVFFRGRILRQWYLMDVLTDSACTITVTFDCSTVSIILNRTTVLNYEAGWAVVHGHSREDSCVPKEPYFAAAFVLGSSTDQVNLVPLVTEVRSGRAVSLS